jgi:hypothetical protein
MVILKKFWEQITKNVREAPGWALPFAVCYIAVPRAAEHLPRFAACLDKHREFAAVVVTALLYAIGDALDTAVFPREKDGKWSGWRKLAPAELGKPLFHPSRLYDS